MTKIKRELFERYTHAETLLAYDPETGVVTWKEARGSTVKKGQVAGSTDPRGYVTVRIDRKPIYVHRLAWLIMTGENSKLEIDHINGNPSDNRWSNLRQASRKKQMLNTKSRFKPNYCLHETPHGSWTVNVRGEYLGSYRDRKKAVRVRDLKLNQLFIEKDVVYA